MRASLVAAVVASIVAFSASTGAQATIKQLTAIPAQELAPALHALVKEREFQIIYSSELVADRRTGGATGELTMSEALTLLLSGSGLTYQYVDDKTVAIVPIATQPAKGKRDAQRGKAETSNQHGQQADGVQKKSFWDRFRVAQVGQVGQGDAGAPAPTENEEDLEEITITGIRKSIEDSIRIKRDLDVVSDTISAEDVGQFPDGNLAESLQRITGVQITRQSPDGVSANEGQHVSVRGLPTEFNYVGLNGEGVASASNNLIAYTADRNFNFSALAPDFISSLEVYKSPSADLTEGGVAATINVKTVLPFDIGQRVFKASAEGQSTSRATRALPKLSAIYSDVFADGLLGFTAGYALNKRKYASTSVTSFQLDPQPVNGQNYLGLNGNFIFNTQDDYDTRTAYGALQYRPISDLTFSLVALHTTTDDDAEFAAFGVRPFFGSTYSNVVADANGVLTTLVGEGIYYETANYNHLDATSLDNFTLKAEWRPGSLAIDGSLDYSDSVSTNDYFVIDALEWGAAGVGPAYSGGYEIRPGDPIASFVLDPTLDASDPSNFFINLVGGNTLRRENAIRSARADATYDLSGGVVESIKVGARYAEERSTNAGVFNYEPTRRLDSIVPYVTNSAIPTPTLSGYNGSADVPFQYPYLNPQSYLDALYGSSHDAWLSAATTEQIPNPTNEYTVKEKNTGLYAMARYKFDWHFPVRGNLGVRFVHTQQAVTNTAVDLNEITIISPPPPPPAPSVIVPAGTRYTLSRSYDDVLPSFNLAMELKSDLVLRLAAAKVMSRPTLDSLVPRYSVSAGAANTVTGGNPQLNPFRAWQGDLSLEYYFQPGSIASVALFYKDVQSFIQTQHKPLVLQGVTFDQTLPVNSSGGYVEGVEAGYTQQFKSLPSFWSGIGVQANATWAKGRTDADPDAGLKAHAFQNLSKWTANASVFYSAYGVNARLAYNYRSDYLFDDNVRGIGTTAAYGNAFSTLDFQSSYAITSHLTVFAEANNLTRKPQVFLMRVSNGGESLSYPQTWIEGERRLAAGLRISF